MSDTVAKTVNKYLKALFDVTTDEIYRSLVSREDGVPEPLVTKPADLNIGALASMLEWLRTLAKELTKQMDMTQAEGEYLNLIIHTHMGIVRWAGETDTQYVQRVQDFLVHPKISPASIIEIMRQFSTDEPIIIEAAVDSAFADVTFSDNYTGFRNETIGSPEYQHFIFPAIGAHPEHTMFFFILILTETNLADIPKILEYVDRWIAAGVAFEIQIKAS